MKKWFESEAAKDSGVLLGTPDTGGEVLLFHGIGDHNEMGCDAGGQSFGRAKGDVAQVSLEGTKGGPMDGVDNQGYTSSSCGQATQYTGFAAMGMDDVRPAGTKEREQSLKRKGVLPRMQVANQFRNFCEKIRRAIDERFK